ncbi:MAG: GGDEF domain-containing protein [Chloroflexota bacterium]|nr:GGDEF domain-containing protein [Dehalococcoidia bacterium]MDW8253262.1 GGDEF domain-containing protein [Chloroflexota bacterium]
MNRLPSWRAENDPELPAGYRGLAFPEPLETAYQRYLDRRFRSWLTVVAAAIVVSLVIRAFTIPFFTLQDIPPTVVVAGLSISTFVLFVGWNIVVLLIALLALIHLLRGGTVLSTQWVAVVGGLILVLSFLVAHTLRTTPSYLSPIAIPVVVFVLVLGFRLGFLLTASFIGLIVAAQAAFSALNTFSPLVNVTALFIVLPYLALALLIAYLLERDARNDFLAQRALQRQQRALAEHSQRLAEEATTDELTQVANRRKFEETIAAEWRRARRTGEPLSLVMIDIDHFKQLNDRFGHQRGDEVLLLVAERLRAFAQRPGDLLARYGGEEFALILSGAALPAGRDIAERLRRAVEGLAIPNGADPPGVVTVSAGVATIWPRLGEEAALLVQAADAALYRAKLRGRNRVETATLAVLPPEQSELERPESSSARSDA